MAEIRLTRNGKEESITLEQKFTVGRLSTNTLQVDDEAVSREHAAIEQTESGYTVRDLDSRNGTFVERGGRTWKVEGALGLEAGDVIRVGNLRMTYVAPEEMGQGLDPGATVVGRIIPPLRDAGRQ